MKLSAEIRAWVEVLTRWPLVAMYVALIFRKQLRELIPYLRDHDLTVGSFKLTKAVQREGGLRPRLEAGILKKKDSIKRRSDAASEPEEEDAGQPAEAGANLEVGNRREPADFEVQEESGDA